MWTSSLILSSHVMDFWIQTCWGTSRSLTQYIHCPVCKNSFPDIKIQWCRLLFCNTLQKVVMAFFQWNRDDEWLKYKNWRQEYSRLKDGEMKAVLHLFCVKFEDSLHQNPFVEDSMVFCNFFIWLSVSTEVLFSFKQSKWMAPRGRFSWTMHKHTISLSLSLSLSGWLSQLFRVYKEQQGQSTLALQSQSRPFLVLPYWVVLKLSKVAGKYYHWICPKVCIYRLEICQQVSKSPLW